MIETSSRGSTKLPKTIDFLKEQMSSKETEKMSDKNFHISNACLKKKRMSFSSRLMEKSLTNFLLFPHTPYPITVDQASLCLRQEHFKVDS